MFSITFSILLSISSISQENDNLNKADLIVKVQNIQNNKGSIRVSLFDSKEDYLIESCKSIVKPAKEGEMVFVFENVSRKTYSLLAYHDENNNNEVDTYFFSLPKEAYGFSNNARSLFGPPSFESSKFIVDSNKMVISFNLE